MALTAERTTPAGAIDAAPRYALAWAALICAIAALTLAHPALTGGFLVNPRSDQYIAGYAFRDFAASTLKATGGFPQWNPYVFGGLPYISAMHGDIFYPTFLLRLILPTDLAMTWGMILHFWLAGVAMFAFLRAHRLSFHASLAGALAYMLSGQVGGLVSPGHDGKLFITALLPLTLLVIRHGIRDGRRSAWGLLALVVGLAILTPHPQLFQYLLLASGAYALWCAYFEGGDGAPSRPVATRRLALALGAVVLGMAIGAIQFLPLRAYTAWSPRAAGHDWQTATSYSMPPEETINWVLPQFSGILDNYWGRNGIHFHSEYIGLPVILLAVAAFAIADARKKKLVWFATGLAAVSWLWSLGGFTPFYKLVAAIIPGTMYFRAPSTIMFETSFAIALLAALGVDRILSAGAGRKYFIGGAIAVGVITILGAAGGFTSIVSNALSNEIASGRVQPEQINANSPNVTLGAIRMAFFAALMLAALGGIAARKLSLRLASFGVLAVIVADLWSVERDYWNFSARASTVFARDAVIDTIKSNPEPMRVVTMVTAPGAAYRDPYLTGDGLMVHGVREFAGYHGNELHRYDELYWSAYHAGEKGPYDIQTHLRNTLSPTISTLLNVGWLYTNSGEIPAPYVKVAGPVKNSAGTSVWLYKLPGEHPLAWVAPAIVKAPDDVAAGTLLQADVARSVAIFDTSSKVTAERLTTAPPPLTIHAKTTHYAPGAIDIELDAPAPAKSALIVSENFYPGWTALVDGKPATVERADYVVMGVPLEAGSKKIELRFADLAYPKGKVVTFLAIGLAVLLAAGGFAADRRGMQRA